MKKSKKSATKTAIKSNWNLKLLYKSHTDPAIEADLKKVEKANDAFEKKYKTAGFTKDEKSIFNALRDYEKLFGMKEGASVYLYFNYAKDLNANDQKAEAEMNKTISRLTASGNKIIFFELAIAKIPAELQKKYLTSKKLEHFRYFLENVFKRAKHNLSEPEEKIMSLKSLPSREMWISSSDKLLSKQTVLWKEKNISTQEAANLLVDLPRKERNALDALISKKLFDISDFAEAEINAIYTDKKINDELRGYKNPYDSTFLGYETAEKMVMALREAVTKGFKISNRFYKLKAKLLKQDKLSYVDRVAGIGTTKKKVSFEESLATVKKAFGTVDKDFEAILDRFISNGQIDVYPKPGKTGGAYCSSSVHNPTFVLLNHVGSINSMMTLAHEMGHGIHAEYAKSQSPIYEGHSIAVAEVASTFFEEVVFSEVFKTLSPKEQIIALHNKLNDNISTICRQIAFFNFELELHQLIRAKGAVAKEEIAALMNKHVKAYLGPAFEMKDIDGYFFVKLSHMRRFFYVYAYSFGELVSKALYRKYQKDNSYIESVKSFLRAGGSKSPHDIFNDIGINTADPKFWEEGLALIEDDVKTLEKLTKK